MTFSQPGAGGDSFTPAEHNGHLLIVYPKSYQDEVQTKNGLSSVADADIVIVDKFGPDGKPVIFHNARLFGNLARSVRNDIGGQVLGRLGQGPNTRGTPPWILANFTEQDAAAATPVDTAYRQGQFAPTQPSASAQTAPAQQWNAGAAPTAAPGPSPATAPQYAPPAQQQSWPTATPPPQQQWNAPAPAAPAAPPPAPTAASAPAPAVDPNLVAFLTSRGITVTPDMTQPQCEAIAAALPQ